MKQSIGEFLAILRRSKGYTQQEVAERLGVSNKTISAWERGTVLPDILLLPALAELYGVTADDILAGERRSEGNAEEKFSLKSEVKLLKSKLAKFTTQTYILGGVFFAGAILLYFGALKHVTTAIWTGFRWWLPLIWIGFVTIVVSFAVVIALFRGAEKSADEDAENFPKFCILLYRKVSRFGYFACVTALLCAFITLGFFVSGTNFTDELSFLTAFCVIISFLMFLLSFGLNGYALKKWDGERADRNRKKNGKLYGKTALFGLIPFAVALALIIVLSFVNITTIDLLYSADRESFRIFMETVQVNGREYHIPLSSLSENLGTEIAYGEQYHFDENVSYCFYADAFCEVQIRDEALIEVFDAERLTAEDGFFVYNLHEGMMGGVTIGGNTVYDMHDEIRTDGNTAYYERVFLENFGDLGRFLGTILILGDFIVCFIVCAVKREKTVVKL